jgi:hypothetical protein
MLSPAFESPQSASASNLISLFGLLPFQKFDKRVPTTINGKMPEMDVFLWVRVNERESVTCFIMEAMEKRSPLKPLENHFCKRHGNKLSAELDICHFRYKRAKSRESSDGSSSKRLK